MLNKKASYEQISDFLDISIDEIKHIEKEMLVDKKVDLSKMALKDRKLSIAGNVMPPVTGMVGKNIIPQLENAGYRVEFKGVGRVMEQFPLAGTVINRNQRIYLRLQN